MTLEQQIQEATKEAMKAKDHVAMNAIRANKALAGLSDGRTISTIVKNLLA